MSLRGVGFHGFPAFTAIELHPIVFTVFYFSGVFQSLCEEFAEIFVVRSVFEAKVADVAEVLVELLCAWLAYERLSRQLATYQGSHRTSP